METYNIIKIKKEIYYKYKNNTQELYKIIYNLYTLNKKDITYGITIYHQICEIINENINKYIKLISYKKEKNKYTIIEKNNKSLLIIKPSNIIYKTNKINKNTFYILNNYNKYLLICNFKKQEYFWIKDEIK